MISEFLDVLTEQQDRVVTASTAGGIHYMVFADGTLRLFKENANGSLVPIPPEAIARNIFKHDTQKVVSVAAHPFVQGYAVAGITGGHLLFWSVNENVIDIRSELLSADVVHVKWLSHGRLLAAADAVGKVVLLAFDPLSLSFALVHKIQRTGRVIGIEQRGACVQNYYLNAPVQNSSQEGQEMQLQDRIFPILLGGPLEVIIAWEKGDVFIVQDANKAPVVCTVSSGVSKLIYQEDVDVGCCISPLGDLVVFGFESVAWRAKRVVLSRTKVEMSQMGGACTAGPGVIAYVGAALTQVKFYDVVNQQAAVVELDDYLPDFDQITGEIQWVPSLGVVVPMRKKGIFAVLAPVAVDEVSELTSLAQSSNYALMGEKKKDVEAQKKKLEYCVKEVISCDSDEKADCFVQGMAQADELSDAHYLLLSNKTFKSPQEEQHFSILALKRPVVGTSNLMNAAILAQTLANESLESPEFLDHKFMDARNCAVTAVQTGGRSLKVVVMTSRGAREEYSAGVQHRIDKLVVSQLMGGARTGYLLAFGQGHFTTFEVGEGIIPAQVDSFQLDTNEHQVNDCLLFGKYIIAAVDSKFTVADTEFKKAELLKLTFAGKVSQTLPVNYSPEGGSANASLRAQKLLLVNQHLFFTSPSAVLFYADLRTFAKAIQVAKLRQDYLFAEAAQVSMKPLVSSLQEEGEEEEVHISAIGTVPETFNLNSVQVREASASLSLESANAIILCFTFCAFSEILNKTADLSQVLTLQLSAQELSQLLQSSASQEPPQATYRVFDFSPLQVRSAFLDPMGNLSVELQDSAIYRYLSTGFSSCVGRRFQLPQKALVFFSGGALLKRIADENADQADEDEPVDQQIDGMSLTVFTRFLNIRTAADARALVAYGSLQLCFKREVAFIQGLFNPFVVPKVEALPISAAGVLLATMSPAVLCLNRSVPRPRDGFEKTGHLGFLALQIIAAPSLFSQGTDPLKQSPQTSHTLSKFIKAVENNRFDDAYAAVSQSESAEIWRSLAGLCIKNGYLELLKTCVSHLKSPMTSLLLRAYNQGSQQVKDGASLIGTEAQAQKNQELAAVLSIALGELGAGVRAVSKKPILHAKIMQQAGLGTKCLTDDAQGQQMGFNSITRKSSVYLLAQRLQGLGDMEGANACYGELFSGQQELGKQKQYFVQTDEQRAALQQNVRLRQQIQQTVLSEGLPQAVQEAKRLSNKAALYEAAHALEEQAERSGRADGYFEAARIYSLAGCYQRALKNALRCANDELIYTLGSTAQNVRLSLLAAGYFAQKSQQNPEALEKALILYSCSGYSGQAVELCLQTGKLKELCGLLNDIIGTKRDAAFKQGDTMDEGEGEENSKKIKESKERLRKANVSPELLTKAGQVLISVDKSSVTLEDYNNFVKIGVLALAHAHAVDQALYCIAQGIIPITVEMADLLTPEDTQEEGAADTIKTIGKLLFKAELYAAAVRKFISINDSVLALQALIKLGDTNKVVKFAQMSRSKECFIAAANFLQAQNFRDAPKLMELIIQFYAKAHAFDKLIKFFINCAREEIDSFNDYEKAMDALREAAKWIGKAMTLEGLEDATRSSLEIQKKIIEQNGRLINGFLQIIEYAQNNLNAVEAADYLSEKAKKLLQAVVKTEDCFVQPPHILAFLCEFHSQRGEEARVVSLLQNMEAQEIEIHKYVDPEVLRKYGQKAGITATQMEEQHDDVQDELDKPPVDEDDLNIEL